MGIADELITRGWAQYSPERSDGSVCLVGAARIAAGRDAHRGRLPSGWRGVLDDLCGGKTERFNDARHRTFDEVLRVAKEADEILDGESNA